MKNTGSQIILACFFLILAGCYGPEQDIPVDPAEQPYYSISGQVIYAFDNSVVPFSSVSVEMEILIQGDWVDRKDCTADSNGRFQIDSLYRGQYRIEATRNGLLKFSKSIVMMQYSDREYDIIIPPHPDLVLRGNVTRCSDAANLSEVQLILESLRIENGGVVDAQTEITNSIGNFQFRNLYEGTYSLTALKGNYARGLQTVYIPDNGEAYFELDFCMNESISP